MMIEAHGVQPLFFQSQTFTQIEFRLGMLEWGDKLIDCTFQDCDIHMQNPDSLLLCGCQFHRCTFSSKSKVSLGARFSSNYWEDCVFKGVYEGTQFGYWSEDVIGRPCPWGDIAIKGCDFSQGIFDGCMLSKADIDSIRFPKWPHFTVINPSKNYQAWRAADLPFLDMNPRLFEGGIPDTSAIIFEWSSIVKAYTWRPLTQSADPQEVKAALQKFDFIRL